MLSLDAFVKLNAILICILRTLPEGCSYIHTFCGRMTQLSLGFSPLADTISNVTASQVFLPDFIHDLT